MKLRFYLAHFCLQEDMDSMQKELDIWRRENKEHEVALRREER